MRNILGQKVFKFLLGGGIAAVINILLIMYFIEVLNFNTPVLRNIANIISIEISLVASFFIYRKWVWAGGSWKIKDVMLRQLPLYHLAAGSALAVRVLVIFPILDWIKVNYAINTLVGVVAGAAINYVISDRLVFKDSSLKNSKSRQRARATGGDLFSPEGLEPALEPERDVLFAETNQRNQVRHNSGNYSKVDVLSVVIPAYNEDGCIVQTVESLSYLLEQEEINYEILVVNDNSRDRTEELLQQLSYQNGKVRYVNNYYPNGFGFAVRCGLENFQGDAVAVVMADSSDSPENLVEYYYKLQEGHDCVFGSRFIKGGKVIEYPKHKLIVNRLANLFIQVIFGLKFNDITNAFKIYRREVIEGISPLISHHFNLTVEMPLKAIVRGYSYTTIPITWQNRKTGVSKLKLKEMGSRYLFIVLDIWLEKYLSRGDYVRKHSQVSVSAKNQ
jgi:dolichol-phosphate mannosyltransferase